MPFSLFSGFVLKINAAGSSLLLFTGSGPPESNPGLSVMQTRDLASPGLDFGLCKWEMFSLLVGWL